MSKPSSAPRRIALWAAVLAGCPTNLGDPPPDAVLLCARDDDCPERQTCQALLRRCVADTATADLDVVDVVIAPAHASLDDTVEATFRVTAPLARDPIVRLDPGSVRLFAVDEGATARADGRWVFTLAPDSRDQQGTSAVLVELYATNGASLPTRTLGVVTLDFAAPELVSATVAPRSVVAGETAVAQVRMSEPVANDPASIEDFAAAFVDAAGTVHPAVVTPTADPSAVDVAVVAAEDWAPGIGFIEVLLADAAGNAVPRRAVDLVVEIGGRTQCPLADVCVDFDDDGFPGAPCFVGGVIDCDDQDSLTRPGAPEIPGDGVDNDCAGDGDVPISEDVGVFVDERTSLPPGDGTRAAPFDTLAAALSDAVASSRIVFVRGDAFAGVIDATVPGIVGGLDDAWALDPGLRSRLHTFDAVTWTLAINARVLVGIELQAVRVEAGLQEISISRFSGAAGQQVYCDHTLRVLATAHVQDSEIAWCQRGGVGATVRIHRSVVGNGLVEDGQARIVRSRTLGTIAAWPGTTIVLANVLAHDPPLLVDCTDCALGVFHATITSGAGGGAAPVFQVGGGLPLGPQLTGVLLVSTGLGTDKPLLATSKAPALFAGNAVPAGGDGTFLAFGGVSYDATDDGLASLEAAIPEARGNSNALPSFADGAGEHLAPSSALVDVGVDPLSAQLAPTALAGDFEGDCRFAGDAPDIGADEVR